MKVMKYFVPLVCLFLFSCTKEIDTTGMNLYQIDSMTFSKQMEENENSGYINVTAQQEFSVTNYDKYEVEKNGVKFFPIGEEVLFSVNFSPSVIKEKSKGIKKRYRSTEVLIPVKIIIARPKKIFLKQIGGLHGDSLVVSNNADGSQEIYSFHIKNDAKTHPSLKFMFRSEEIEDVEISISYGTDKYKIVDSNCDFLQKVHFVKLEK